MIINKKTFEVNLSLYTLYEVVCNLYYSQYPSYPKDINAIRLNTMRNTFGNDSKVLVISNHINAGGRAVV